MAINGPIFQDHDLAGGLSAAVRGHRADARSWFSQVNSQRHVQQFAISEFGQIMLIVLMNGL